MGPPTMEATGMAVMNRETARPRSREGNQAMKYSSIPGKKPASAVPSSTRSA